MARQPQSRGACAYCGKDIARGGMTKHLSACPARAAVLTQAESSKRRAQSLYHLVVNTPASSHFWLHLESNGTATLEDLDEYLRAIWLECCGHLSAFTIGETSYTQIFEDDWRDPPNRSMNVRADKVLLPGMSIPYEYDFGSTTELVINVHSVRRGKPTTEHPIALMARNHMPEILCAVCGQPAVWICVDCLWDDGDEYLFCEEHADEHAAESEHEDMMLSVCNSPRMGVCGYSGPAEPPY